MSADFWNGKRVLVTGHTGFKGSWLSLWLQSLGADVHGLALPPPTTPSLFEQARVATGMVSVLADIRDADTTFKAVADAQPEIVIHMAAQPLVRLSYRDPITTYATNVMGTVHVLEACRRVPSIKAVVNVTTDKCYDNKEWVWGYREDDPMGGHDPYSSSKGCAELITSAYRCSFFMQEGSAAIASARAGNVIGGGDWAADRLVPDVLKAFEQGAAVLIRNPTATRPWQHVLEPLHGYLTLAQRLYQEGHAWAEGWNFGPQSQDVRPVQWIVEHLAKRWGDGASWTTDQAAHPHEAHCLKLDISKAQSRLGWEPRWDLVAALDHTIDWYRAWLSGDDLRAMSLAQIDRYTRHQAHR